MYYSSVIDKNKVHGGSGLVQCLVVCIRGRIVKIIETFIYCKNNTYMSINWLKIYWLARVIALRNHQSIIFILKVYKEFIILRLIKFNINKTKHF